MAVVRRNILFNPAVRDAYLNGIMLLKNENTTALTTAFGIAGPPVLVRTYDLFVIWHHMTMMTPVPPGGSVRDRNAAHRGPIFLPWHRVMLAFLEQGIQRVLNDPTFGLPYWDWSVDGSLPFPFQPNSPIWSAEAMGGQGDPVSNGRFAFNAGDPASFRVRIETDPPGILRQADRGLRRRFGVDSPSLPSALDVGAAFNTFLDPSLATYDGPNFDRSSSGFRNRLEGFIGTGLHNQVHRWVGGDMVPESSPNDPVFYLHHANVDRLWESWMVRNGRNYLPDMTAPATLLGHRIDDPIVSPLLGGMTVATPRLTLDISANYTYDLLV